MNKLSVVIPAYNEIDTIHKILSLVIEALPDVTKEIIIVDDYSHDGTREWITKYISGLTEEYYSFEYEAEKGVDVRENGSEKHGRFCFKTLFHEKNMGKGAALRTGLKEVTGDVIVIQDADLEYDPHDWERMWPLITERKAADIVYGSRFYGGMPHRCLYFHHYLANRVISFLFNLLYNQTISDVEVCYKMFTRDVLDSLSLTADDFGFEIEFSTQVAKAKHWRIYELSISYFGRTYEEGKKINWRDGLKALWYLLKFRYKRNNYSS